MVGSTFHLCACLSEREVFFFPPFQTAAMICLTYMNSLPLTHTHTHIRTRMHILM